MRDDVEDDDAGEEHAEVGWERRSVGQGQQDVAADRDDDGEEAEPELAVAPRSSDRREVDHRAPVVVDLGCVVVVAGKVVVEVVVVVLASVAFEVADELLRALERALARVVDLIDRVGCELRPPQMGGGLDGRLPTEDAAGHALEHDDAVALEVDVVGVVRVPVDGADPHADDHEHGEHVEQHAAEAAQSRPPPRRLVDGNVGCGNREGCARHRGSRQRFRIGRGGRRRLEHVDDEDGDVVLTAGLVGRVDETIGRDPRIGVELGDAEHVVVAHHGGQAVGAEQQAVARPRVDRVEIDVDVRVDAERS